MKGAVGVDLCLGTDFRDKSPAVISDKAGD